MGAKLAARFSFACRPSEHRRRSPAVFGKREALAVVLRLLLVALAVALPRVSFAEGSARDLERGISLTGPWAVYPGVLLGIDEVPATPPAGVVRLPRDFGGLRLEGGVTLAERGALSVVIEHDLPRTKDALGIALTRVWGSSQLECRVYPGENGGGGVVTYALGRPGLTDATTRNLQRSGVMPLPPGDHLRCVMQFANFAGVPGLSTAPKLGRLDDLNASWLFQVALNALLFGVLVSFAAYHLILFPVRRERSYLYFALVSVAVATRAAIATRLFESFFPGSDAIEIIWGLDIGAIALASSGAMLFLAHVLGDHVPRAFRAPYFVAGLSIFGFSFTRRWLFASETVVAAAQVYFVIGVVFAVAGMVRAFRKRDVPDLNLLVAGLGAAMVGGVYELIAARSSLPDVQAVALGMFSFVSCQGLLLVRRTERMHEATDRLARELNESNAELARADALKDSFVAATSHELKTPLHGMIGLMESVRDELSPRVRQSLDLAVASGRRLDTQISGLLDFAKLRRDELTLEVRSIDTLALIDSVVAASQGIIAGRPLVFRKQIANGIAPIAGDESRVRQVLFHVVGNAVKFTERGTIDVRAVDRLGFVDIVVTDTGCGIAPENQSRVFDAFTQESAVDTRLAGGTGLGLAISKRLMELHGGTVELRSVLGEGTSVTLSFPASKEMASVSRDDAMPVAMPVEYATAQVPDLDGSEVSAIFDRRSLSIVTATGPRDDRLAILAVDDDPVNLRVLSTQLRPAGYRVVLASDGVQALEVFDDEGPFDLVLLDVMMPRMSGLEALRLFREKATRAELPVILLTAKQQQEDVIAGFDAGANDYLAKPFSKKELLARIETHLTVAKTNHALRRFVPQEFLAALGRKHVTEVRLGDSVERRLAILFGDIRDFTRISEGLGPEKTFRFVNQCLQRITPFVRENGGFIDKFIGDAVLALFPEAPHAAVDAAIAIERAIDEAGDLDDAHRFAFGIGIHVGATMMGTIGDERRFEATVISDAVNQAARLEGMTKHVGARVLVSGEMVDELGTAYAIRKLGAMRAVGKDRPIEVSEVLDADPWDLREKKIASSARFQTATASLRAGSFAAARDLFASLAEEEPRDGASKFFLAACDDALAGQRVVEDGTIILNRK